MPRRGFLATPAAAFLALLAIGLLLRMLALGSKALWQDEGTSVYYAQLPLHVWYSQEARPYALLSALALAMTAAGMWWWRRPGLARAAAYVLAGWLALSVEYGALVAWVRSICSC